MAGTSTMTLQTIWDCRWSRPARSAEGEPVDPTDGPWVCVRPRGDVVRRPVREEECASCPHWQAAWPDEDI